MKEWPSTSFLELLVIACAGFASAIDGQETPPPLAFGSPIVVQASGSGAGEPTLQAGSDGTMWLTDLFQIRKSIDHGATWLSIAPPLSRGGSDMDAAQAADGRVHAVDLDRGFTCILYYRSFDGNAFTDVHSTAGDGVWHSADGACAAASGLAVIDRPWVATSGTENVFIGYTTFSGSSANRRSFANIDVSKDGGETFLHSVLDSEMAQSAAVAIDPSDGSLYVVSEVPGPYDLTAGHNTARAIIVAASKDGGTFASSTVIRTDTFNLHQSEFPAIAVDSAHNVYVGWSDNSAGTVDVYISVSRDRGATWSSPIRVTHGLTVSVYPTITAGDGGRIALAWYGTADPAKSRGDAHGASWDVYAAVSTNATESEPAFEIVKVTDQPFHHNSMCTHLQLCEGISNGDPPGYEDGILDFFRIAVDRAGLINLVWSDTTGPYPKDHFTQQTGGPLLKIAGPRRRAVKQSDAAPDRMQRDGLEIFLANRAMRVFRANFEEPGTTEAGLPSIAGTQGALRPTDAESVAFAPPVLVAAGNDGAAREPTLHIARDGTLWVTELSPAQILKSTDGGATWSQAIAPPLASGGGDMDAETSGDGRLHTIDLKQDQQCIFYYRSSDGAASFDKIESTRGDGIWKPGDTACSSTSATLDRPWVATSGPTNVYFAYGLGQGAGVDVSTDSGETFTHGSLAQFPGPDGFAVDPTDGTMYLIGALLGSYSQELGRNLGRAIVVAASTDGRKFSLNNVVTTDQFDVAEGKFAAIAVDSAHNVYAAWCDNSAGTYDVYVSVSRDHGTTWSAPARVSHDVTDSTYPTLVAGDAGRVAVAWFGTPDPAKAHNDAPGANWYVYAAVSTNADGPNPSFASVRVTDQPFRHGSICAHMVVCEGLSDGSRPQGYERGLLDFFRIAADSSGNVNIVWPDTTLSFPRDFIVRQSGGPRLRGPSPRHRAIAH